MEYKTGSYLITGRKEHTCKICNLAIHTNIPHFARVQEYGEVLTRSDGAEFRNKNYDRFHLECARTLTNLNDYELGLINR